MPRDAAEREETMNKAILIGRLTRDPEMKASKDKDGGDLAVAKYTLAVDRRGKREDGKDADFIPCTAFGKAGEFAGKYFRKGQKVAVCGRIQTGDYTNKEGIKVYTTDVIVEEQDFADSKRDGEAAGKGGIDA